MDVTQLQDLKEFIDGRLGQAETRINEELGEKIEQVDLKVDNLRGEMLDGFQGVGEAIEEINHRIDRLDTSKRPV